MSSPTPPPGTERHPGITELLQWFEYDHLPKHLRVISEELYTTAHNLVDVLPDSPELTTGLRKLLEAKDCFVRARVAATREPQSR
jgi:hypothetical protein